jgi:hypothetical protein
MRVSVVVADQVISVDGDPRKTDFSKDKEIQKVLKKDPTLQAIQWEGGGGHVQRHGLSGFSQDKGLIDPFIAAWKVQKVADAQAAKAAIAKKEKEQADIKKREDDIAKADEKKRQEAAKEIEANANIDRAYGELNTSDVIVLRLTELGLSIPDHWVKYREALREIIRTNPPKVKWPTIPPKPKELS